MILSRFLRFFSVLVVVASFAFVNNARAGYTCTVVYTSCTVGHWLHNQNCVVCPPNATCAGGTAAFSCNAGWWRNGAATTCTQCPAGTHSSAGATSCTDCPAGQYSAAGSATCTNCPANHISANPGAASCTECPAGTAPNAARTQCDTIVCPAGEWLNGSTCTACPPNATCPNQSGPFVCDAGWFRDGNDTTCTQCIAGTYSSAGATSCTNCPVGTYSAAGAATCSNCPAGTYNATVGSASCTNCPADTYSSPGAASCVTCPPGHSCTTGGGITECPAGTYSALGSTTCTACPPGQYSLAGSGSCTDCPAGSSCTSTGTITECPAGTYSALGSMTCTNCPAGQYSAAGSASCSTCPAGTYSAEGSASCTNCPADTYSSPGAASCVTCPPGHNCTTGGGITECPAGTYSALGSTTCTPCPSGTFSAAGAASCADCPAGHSCTPTDSTECPAGTYSPVGSMNCTPCPSGQHSLAGSASCTTCPAGYSCTSDGTVTECPAGTFSAVGEMTCTDCPAGTYSGAGAASCTNCPPGMKSGIGSAACTDCTTPGMVCVDGIEITCPIGTYSNATTAASQCIPCPGGQTTSAAGASSCDAACPNVSNVDTWVTSVWDSSDNTVSNVCVIDECVPGFGTGATGTPNANACPIVTFTISYSLNDFVGASAVLPAPMPTTYTVTTATITLPNPTRLGYIFGGWCDDPSTTVNCAVGRTIPLGSVGNKDLYARWVIVNFVVAFDGNGSTGGTVPSQINCIGNSPCALPDRGDMIRAGHRWTGWCEPGGGGTCYADGDDILVTNPTEGQVITLNASWAPCGPTTYSNTAANTCDTCQSGWFSIGLINATCTICPAGSRCDAGVRTACAGLNEWQPDTGQSICESVPPGHVKTGLLNDAIEECGYGRWCINGIRTACPAATEHTHFSPPPQITTATPTASAIEECVQQLVACQLDPMDPLPGTGVKYCHWHTTGRTGGPGYCLQPGDAGFEIGFEVCEEVNCPAGEHFRPASGGCIDNVQLCTNSMVDLPAANVGGTATWTGSGGSGHWDKSECYRTGLPFGGATVFGSGTQTCFWTSGTGVGAVFDSACKDINITQCDPGHWRASAGAVVCSLAPVGYFSPDDSITPAACPTFHACDTEGLIEPVCMSGFFIYATGGLSVNLGRRCRFEPGPCDIANGTGMLNTNTGVCDIVSCNFGFELSLDGLSCVSVDLGTTCSTGFEWDGTGCVPCDVDNALTFRTGCEVATCRIGYHVRNNECVPNVESCSIPNGQGEREWVNGNWGSCRAVDCDLGFHIANNACISNIRTCAVANGSGQQEWIGSATSGHWGDCEATSCHAGFTYDRALTNQWNVPCGRCNNAFGSNGEIVVASFAANCQILVCMHHNEKYLLEGNECVPICEPAADETGNRLFNPGTGRCEHFCEPGYVPWPGATLGT